jgi:Domain of unknown function (DUF1877)
MAMAGGVFFALDDLQLERLLAARGDEALMSVVSAIGEDTDPVHQAQCGQAWDALHRCLTDGSLGFEAGQYPLNRVVLGGRQLHQGDGYLVSLVMPGEVRDVARALASITREWLHERYFTLLPSDDAPGFGEQDFTSTWAHFQAVQRFYARAADVGRAVIFTVDQWGGAA